MSSGHQQEHAGPGTGLLRYVWRHSRWQQGWLLAVVLVSLPTYFLAFDLPRRIINGPIQGAAFPAPDSTVALTVPAWPAWLGGAGPLGGVEVTRWGALVTLSLLFLAVVVANGLFKLHINTFKGKLGERMLRRLRFDLVDRLLRFPVPRVRRMRPAEVASIVKDETEPLGGFIGDAFVQPLHLGGQALTALVFILVQHLWLGLMAAAIVALQGLIIPRLRRRLVALGRERQRTARQLAGRVGELVEGMPVIRANALTHHERADVSARLGRIYWIRFDIYRWKFLIKFLNNFIAQITPFLFYLLGGYLVLRGSLDVGQLVAVIAAYRDLPNPLKELIDWDQQRIDAEVKFGEVMGEFGAHDLAPARLQALPDGPVPHLEGPIELVNLEIADEAGGKLLERASLSLGIDERVAVVAPREQEAEALAEALMRLATPSRGRISFGGRDLSGLPEAVTGRRLAYAGSSGFFPQATLRASLVYLLKQAPVAARTGGEGRREARERDEARRSANSALDGAADWIDRSAAGARDDGELLQRLREVARTVRLEDDVVAFGLTGPLDPDADPGLAEAVIGARAQLGERLRSGDLAGLVEPFSETAYHWQSTIAENLMFGAAIGPRLQGDALIANAHLRAVLAERGLETVLYGLGCRIAATSVEMFGDLSSDHPFFAELTFMRPEEIAAYRALLATLGARPAAEVDRADRYRMIRLALGYVEPRHRMELVDRRIAADIVAARAAFRARLPPELGGSIEFYEAGRCVRSASLLDNLLFGRIVGEVAGAPQRVLSAVRALLRELRLDEKVFEAGLAFDIGGGASRLTPAQRQKVDVARALLKRADYLVMNRPLSAVGAAERADILRDIMIASRDPARPFGLLWVLPPAQLLEEFDKVAVLKHGMVESFGPPARGPVQVEARTHVAQR